MNVHALFIEYALANGYEAAPAGDDIIFKNVKNPGNDFLITQTGVYHTVITLRVSKMNYEYMAKCMIYLLLAEYNKKNGDSTHLHINFKVDL